MGHHRSLRAGHVHKGVAWELERTALLLVRRKPETKATGIEKGQAQTGSLHPVMRAKRKTNRMKANGVLGSE